MEHCLCSGSVFQAAGSVFHGGDSTKRPLIFITGTLTEHYWNTGSVPAKPSIHAGCSLVEHWNTDFSINRRNRVNGRHAAPAVPQGKGRGFFSVPVFHSLFTLDTGFVNFYKIGFVNFNRKRIKCSTT